MASLKIHPAASGTSLFIHFYERLASSSEIKVATQAVFYTRSPTIKTKIRNPTLVKK
jgi:hypothetical protein